MTMRTVARLLAACALLVTAFLGLHPAGAAAQTGAYPLSIDAGHRATTGPIFKPNERIAFWFNVPGGSAGGFNSTSSINGVSAKSDGRLDVTFSNDDWRQLPLAATGIVAHGIDSKVDAVYQIAIPADLDLSLHIDANHRITTAPIFARDERIVFWYNLPNGSAVPFLTGSEEVVYARGDGSLDVTISNDHWNLPASAVSVVAHGLSSNLSVAYVVPAK
ncbi:MAG TPA: hypothetical protein VIL85_11465 [Thermomicrobiales bacterium]|jgi:hypothetical protein